MPRLPVVLAYFLAQAKTVSCPQFGTRWSLETGEVVGQWMPSPPVVSSILRLLFRDPEGILTYPVRVAAVRCSFSPSERAVGARVGRGIGGAAATAIWF